MTPPKARVAVLVSGGGTNLQALIDAAARGELPHGEITLVIANKPDAYALTRAAAAGIPGVVITKAGCGGDQEAFEEALLAQLAACDIDLVVLAGFMAILSRRFTDAYPRRILNVHPSLIPAFCGAGFYGLRVHKAALEYGVKVTGATVHYVNEIPDGGEIILQKAVEIQPDDTPETLQRRVMQQAEWVMLPRAVEQVCRRLTEPAQPD